MLSKIVFLGIIQCVHSFIHLFIHSFIWSSLSHHGIYNLKSKVATQAIPQKGALKTYKAFPTVRSLTTNLLTTFTYILLRPNRLQNRNPTLPFGLFPSIPSPSPSMFSPSRSRSPLSPSSSSSTSTGGIHGLIHLC